MKCAAVGAQDQRCCLPSGRHVWHRVSMAVGAERFRADARKTIAARGLTAVETVVPFAHVPDKPRARSLASAADTGQPLSVGAGWPLAWADGQFGPKCREPGCPKAAYSDKAWYCEDHHAYSPAADRRYRQSKLPGLKLCEYCRRKFRPKRKTGRFCSASCRAKAHRER